MYQKCPICNGTGKDPSQFAKVTAPCTVCKGAKIISEFTGLPPQPFDPQDFGQPDHEGAKEHILKQREINELLKKCHPEVVKEVENFDPNKPQWKD